MSKDLLLKLELLSDPSLLCVVRATIDQLTELFGFPAPERRSVTRAVDEALTNIVRHAYGGQPGRPIEIWFRRIPQRRGGKRGDGLEILLCDRGLAVDPAKMQGRRLDEIKPGGLGLHFIRQSMDTVEFTRTRGVNQLRLIKYLQNAKEACNS